VPETAGFDDPTVTNLRAVAASAADANVQFYEALAAAEWPDDAQATVDALTAEVADLAAWLQAVADSTDDASLIAAVQADVPSGASASVLRAKAGHRVATEDCGAKP